MAIKIGAITTLTSSDFTYMPDDRQQTIELIGGVAVQDFGRIVNGDKKSCTITLRSSDFTVLCGYWDSRTRVTVVDDAGVTVENMRVIVKSYKYVKRFENKAVEANVEFWRV